MNANDIKTIANAADNCGCAYRIDEPMSAHTTFEIGGPAAIMLLPSEVTQIQEMLKCCRDNEFKVCVKGLGSNLLVCDEGLDAVVIELSEAFADVSIDGETVVAQAGASNEKIARLVCDAGLAGFEFASGIPGTIGGAAIMNAGAYDGEFKDVAVSVDCITPEGELVTVLAEDADWSYRHSMMADAGYIVVGATMKLTADDPAAIQARMDDLRQRREDKQPLEMPSAGSTFKRPVGYFAGKLIQDSGCQGLMVGGAQISTKHAGFLVNADNATAADVLALISEVQRRVKERDGVDLEPEVRMWGF